MISATQEIEIQPFMPATVGNRREPVPSELIGATILAFGGAGWDSNGGGLVIDYLNEGRKRRIVLSFSEEGMWVHTPPTSMPVASQE